MVLLDSDNVTQCDMIGYTILYFIHAIYLKSRQFDSWIDTGENELTIPTTYISQIQYKTILKLQNFYEFEI